jgi:glycosyltransferase involved in cell wall biosynthesis
MNQGNLTSINKLQTNRTLFIGPLSGNHTGQRISFEEVSSGNFRIDLIKKINILKIPFLFFTFNQVYYTGSRSRLGFLRDLLFIYPFLLTKKRVVNHIHGDDFDRLISRHSIFTKLVLAVCMRIDAIVASTDQANRLKPFFRDVFIVNNFSRFHIEKRSLSKANRSFLYISTISIEKGIFDWLGIAYNLFKFNSEYEFFIIGDNTLELEDLRMYNEAVNGYKKLGMKLDILGKLDFQSLKECLSYCTDLIFTSKHLTENRPLVLLEAASMGVIIHCTSHRQLDKIFGLRLNSFFVDNNYQDVAFSIDNYLQSNDDIEYNKLLIRELFSKQSHKSNIQKILIIK